MDCEMKKKEKKIINIAIEMDFKIVIEVKKKREKSGISIVIVLNVHRKAKWTIIILREFESSFVNNTQYKTQRGDQQKK